MCGEILPPTPQHAPQCATEDDLAVLRTYVQMRAAAGAHLRGPAQAQIHRPQMIVTLAPHLSADKSVAAGRNPMVSAHPIGVRVGAELTADIAIEFMTEHVPRPLRIAFGDPSVDAGFAGDAIGGFSRVRPALVARTLPNPLAVPIIERPRVRKGVTRWLPLMGIGRMTPLLFGVTMSLDVVLTALAYAPLPALDDPIGNIGNAALAETTATVTALVS